MKKLAGIKKEFSLLENHQLTNLEAVTGGTSWVQSNFTNAQGCPDADVYDDNGKFLWRTWCVSVD